MLEKIKSNLFLLLVFNIFLVSSCIQVPLFTDPLTKTAIPNKFNDIIGEWRSHDKNSFFISISRKNEKLFMKFRSRKTLNKWVDLEQNFSAIGEKLFSSYKLKEIGEKLFSSYKLKKSDFRDSKFLIFYLNADKDKLQLKFFSENQIYKWIKNKKIKGKVSFHECDSLLTRKDKSIPDGCMVFDIEPSVLKKMIINDSPKLYNKDTRLILVRKK